MIKTIKKMFQDFILACIVFHEDPKSKRSEERKINNKC